MSLSEELALYLQKVLEVYQEDISHVIVAVNESAHTVVISSRAKPDDLVFEGVDIYCLSHFVLSQPKANIYFRPKANA